MKAKKIGVAVLAMATVAALCVAGWSLNTDDDKRMIEDFALRGLASVRWAVSGNVHDSSVCEIYSDAKGMNGRKVRLRATFWSDHIEHSGLSDLKCPRESIGLVDGRDLTADLVSQLFNELTWKNYTDGPHLIDVEVIGFVESPPRSVIDQDHRPLIVAHRYLHVGDAGVDPTWRAFARKHWPGWR